MKKRSFVLTLLTLFVLPLVFSMDGKEYGKKLTLTKLTKVSAILASPDAFNGKRVLVEGPITGVCEMRGCWITIGSDGEFKALTFKVDDGVIVFPMDAQGKTVRAEGIVEVKTMSVEEQITQAKHHAEEMGEEFDPSTITAPKVSVRLLGEGAVIE